MQRYCSSVTNTDTPSRCESSGTSSWISNLEIITSSCVCLSSFTTFTQLVDSDRFIDAGHADQKDTEDEEEEDGKNERTSLRCFHLSISEDRIGIVPLDGLSDDGSSVDDTKVIVDNVSLLQSLENSRYTDFNRN